MKICAFFGHRECFGLDESRLEAAIEHAIVEYGCSVFWCGGMGAFDWLAARKVRKLKARYPHIRCVRVYAYLPVGKDPNEERCDESFVPDGLETAPRRAAIPRRNAWMARHCDMAIVFLNVSQSGAYVAAMSVHRAGKPVINLGGLVLSQAPGG